MSIVKLKFSSLYNNHKLINEKIKVIIVRKYNKNNIIKINLKDNKI